MLFRSSGRCAPQCVEALRQLVPRRARLGEHAPHLARDARRRVHAAAVAGRQAAPPGAKPPLGPSRSPPATLAVASRYFEVTGPFFGFFGMGLSLYFASQGAGAVGWPVVATVARFTVAVGGSWYLASQPGTLPEHLFMCIAAGMLLYCGGTSAALYLGTWRKSA